MIVLDWLLDADPSVRWQALRDLADAPPAVVAEQRARVADEGWGARLLDLQGDDGQWAGGAYFPARSDQSDDGDNYGKEDKSGEGEDDTSGDGEDDTSGEGEDGKSGDSEDGKSGDGSQPWTATAHTLALLRLLGVDPEAGRVRTAVARVRDHCRWEEGGQPFFAGEVEPCINGLTVALGSYFGHDVDAVVARLLSEQLPD